MKKIENKKVKHYNTTEDNNKMNNTSPLRYPGGKTRACKYLDNVLTEYFNVKTISTIVSPFFGGGSFEFYLQNKYNMSILANDKFTPLTTFWKCCKENKKKLCCKLNKIDCVTKEMFNDYRDSIMTETNMVKQAMYYFVINRCSFSGATLSGGFSQESSEKRFTKSSIKRIENLNLDKFDISNYDFVQYIDDCKTIGDVDTIMFLDPPYYLEKKSKLYGKCGDLHETFDHKRLHTLLTTKKKWIMTYNDCKYIRDLYSKYIIIDIAWKYGMNKTKKSSEIVIICN
jgi:DNA adenine methylase